MKEDSEPATEQGLGPVFDLMVKLNVRPAIILFEIIAYLLCESVKKKTVQSGTLGTSVWIVTLHLYGRKETDHWLIDEFDIKL